MALDGGELAVRVTGDIRRLTEDISRAGQQAGSDFSKKFGTALKGGLLAGGLAAGAFLGNAIKAGSDLEETVNKVNVVFGKSAAGIKDWSQTAATSLRLSKQEALDSAAGFGNMFTQIGFSSQATQKMSTGMVELAADLNSFNNLQGGTAEAVQMLSGAFNGEYDSLQRVIPTINQAAVDTKAMAMTGKDNADSLTQQEKAAAVYALALSEAGPAIGDAARSSDSLAARQGELAAKFKDVSATVGTALLPVVTKIVGAIADNLIPAFEKLVAVGGRVAKFVGDNKVAFLAIAGVITASYIPAMLNAARTTVVSLARMTAGWVAARAQAIASILAQTLGVLRMIATGLVMAAVYGAVFVVLIAGWVASAAAAVASGIAMAAAWVMALGPIGLIIAAIVAIVAVFVILWNKSEAFRDFFIGIWEAIKAVAESVWKAILTAAEAVWNAIKAVVNAVVKAITGYINAWKAVVLAVWNAVKAGATALWNAIKAAVSAVVSFISARWENFKRNISAIWNAIKTAAITAWNAIKTAVTTAVNTVVTTITGIKDKIVGFFTGAGKWLFQAGKNIVQGLINGIKNMAGAAGRAIKGVVDKVTGFLPFSPAKEGPFSGSGAPTKRGAAIVQGLTAGMLSERNTIGNAMDALLPRPGDVAGLVPRQRVAAGAALRVGDEMEPPVVNVYLGDKPVESIVERVSTRREDRMIRSLAGPPR